MHVMTWMILMMLSLALPAMASETDPMRPPAGMGEMKGHAAQQKPRWILQSILVSKQRNIAVINQRTVAVGDRVNGARVLEIHPTYVRLSKEQEVFVIRLPSLQVKRPVNGQ
jgi:hypothetical protein